MTSGGGVHDATSVAKAGSAAQRSRMRALISSTAFVVHSAFRLGRIPAAFSAAMAALPPGARDDAADRTLIGDGGGLLTSTAPGGFGEVSGRCGHVPSVARNRAVASVSPPLDYAASSIRPARLFRCVD